MLKDILPEDYLNQNKNILDYCIGMKSKGAWKQVSRSIDDGVYSEKNLQKINRYYISKSGKESVKVIKVNKDDGREIQCEAGIWEQVIYNNIKLKLKWEGYNINKAYYSKAIESEINNILSASINQLKLF